MAIIRPSFSKKGPGFTEYGVHMRCVRPDETSQSISLHFLKDGNIMFRFSWRKREYMVPVMMILKALIDTNDREIFETIVGPAGSLAVKDCELVDKVEILLRTFQHYQLYTKTATRSYLGTKFRVILGVPDAMSDLEAGTLFLRKIVLVHLGNVKVTQTEDLEKFRTLAFMCRKLYALAAGQCAGDNADAVSNQEILLGGFLYAQIIKERLDEMMGTNFGAMLREYFRKNPGASFTSHDFKSTLTTKLWQKVAGQNIGAALENFLATGNITSPTGLDLQQEAGFTIVAEKLNFPRFISHFRAVHRGAFFTQLRTTTVRKLLPESWGFLCPVHTPDGSPCGLLNHLAHQCKVITRASDVSNIANLLPLFDVTAESTADTTEKVVIMLDGQVLGFCAPGVCKQIHDCLRHWKVEGTHGVPRHLEIGYVPPSNRGSYPGLYMASKASRMVRPVKYLALGKEDFVGPFEQPYMSIACEVSGIEAGETTHIEFSPTNLLSILANMTPFSNHNQSPRNMYQCQMAKQTMGTPTTAFAHRTDNKMYRIQSPQTPVVRPPLHNDYGFDNNPNGTNAIVAVIAYTGYDMDDAMIINKSALERGFQHGTIYKTKQITLKEDKKEITIKRVKKLFGFAQGSIVKDDILKTLDEDGLPQVGAKIKAGDALCAWRLVQEDNSGNLVDTDGKTHYEKYNDSEDAYVDQVRLIGSNSGQEPLQTISVKLRVPRSPVPGDKFSSRHGQKGVLSRKYPAVDMPFTESGMQPDIIINPHAFPSRMTIGMLIESMAGKSGALHGLAQDSTPFRFDENHTAADYFGSQLLKTGYNYYGNEPMYSGITGEELRADIYVGVVYYQRLRHMVNDKYQVRSTGPVVPTTGQPVKGRKRGGGIRVGEMERDALIAHGGVFLMQDRLLNCSDFTKSWICKPCGSFLSVQPTVSPYIGKKKKDTSYRCRACAVKVSPGMDVMQLDGDMWEDGQGNQWIGGDQTTQIVVPGALKYLDVQLAAMGVRLRYRVDTSHETRRGKPQFLPLSAVEARYG